MKASRKKVAGRCSAAAWGKVIAAWQRSGLSGREYCERQGLNLKTFQWWRWRIRTSGAVASDACDSQLLREPAFVPVELIAPHPTPRSDDTGPAIQVVLQRDRRIAIHGDFEVDVLAKVVRVLEGLA